MQARLRQIGRGELAALLERSGEQPVEDFAQGLFAPGGAGVAWSTELWGGFLRAMERVVGAEDARRAVTLLERRRVLQTGCHATASQGPVLWMANVVSSLGCPAQEPLLVGAWSGLSFSNSAWPGCLNLGSGQALESWLSPGSRFWPEQARAWRDRARDSQERRLRLVPGAWRDAPLWCAPAPEGLEALLVDLRGPLVPLLPPVAPGERYLDWALRLCGRLESALLGREVIFFDVGEAVALYLRWALAYKDHPLRWWLWGAGREAVLEKLPPMALWLRAAGPWPSRVQALRHTERLSPEEALALLETGRLRAGVWLSFLVLAGFAGLRCLGGVDQWEYLPLLARAWAQAGPGQSWPVVPGGLTSGRCVDAQGRGLSPLDLLSGVAWTPPRRQSLFALLGPQWPRLLRRPFRWAHDNVSTSAVNER